MLSSETKKGRRGGNGGSNGGCRQRRLFGGGLIGSVGGFLVDVSIGLAAVAPVGIWFDELEVVVIDVVGFGEG